MYQSAECVYGEHFFPVQNAQTPVTQIATDTFGFSANVTNVRGVDQTNVVLTASVLDTAGAVLYTTSLDIPLLTADVVDSFFEIPGVYAPELPLGDYSVVYSSTSDPIGGNVFEDELRAAFKVTENLFAKDDNTTNGIRPGTIPASGYAMGSLYTMSAGALDNYEVKTVEFAHFTNPPPNNPLITQIVADISLFRVKDELTDADWASAAWDRAAYQSTSYDWVGTGTFAAPSNATQGQLHQVELTDLNTALPGVALENGAQYIVSAFYADSSRFVFQAVDEDLELAGPGGGIYFLFYTDLWYTGFTDQINAAVMRMYIDLVVTTDEKPLPDSYMNVFPNPAKDVINLGLQLDKATDITVTIADINGRTVYIDDRYGMSNETLTYQIGQLASGTYLARIATKEGTLTKKFIVQK
ncbi:MAG: T9SS type A sorting domain-containing protein [Lewinellaceae bacterium]|nr:T9SS type A sorting domain-containing protein [Lewinellaceae bacterium]